MGETKLNILYAYRREQQRFKGGNRDSNYQNRDSNNNRYENGNLNIQIENSQTNPLKFKKKF